MDFEKIIKELREKLAKLYEDMRALLEKAESEKRGMTEEEDKTYAGLETEFEKVEADLKRTEKAKEREERLKTPANDPALKPDPDDDDPEKRSIKPGEDREAKKPFQNLGEQLRAIYLVATEPGQPVDKRLLELNEEQRAYAGPSGMNEGIDSEGGFALQTDFAGMIFDTAVKTGRILKAVDSYPVSAKSNGVKWIDIEETDISSTVFGGVQVYWKAEADTVTKSKPKIKAREMLLRELMGIAYATNELLQDTTFISSLYNRAFAKAIERKLEGDIFSGIGAGVPLGILNSGALIAVDPEPGQEADTVVYKNLVKIWNRVHPDSRVKAEWYAHPDVEEQLMNMKFPVGTGGIPVFLPPGGASESPYSRLMGKNIIPTDHCEALGDKGDIYLADLNEYMLIKKGGVESAVSIHVRFLYGEQVFRFTFRANGAPKKNYALTIKNSSLTRSSFVTVKARE